MKRVLMHLSHATDICIVEVIIANVLENIHHLIVVKKQNAVINKEVAVC
jgi:hypothetical protein